MTGRYLADKSSPICRMAVAHAFEHLTEETLCPLHWIGFHRIIQGQWTPQVQRLFDLLILTFSTNEKLADLEALKKRPSICQQDFDDALEYTSQVMHNLVNYKSFGFTKFLPRAAASEFARIVHASRNAANTLGEHIYSRTPKGSLSIGKPSEGQVFNYHLGEVITDVEVAAIQANGPGGFTLIVASANQWPPSLHSISISSGTGKLTVEYDDFFGTAHQSYRCITRSTKYTTAETQTAMLEQMVSTFVLFETGLIEEHKKGSMYWVKDIAPVVESYIGFILLLIFTADRPNGKASPNQKCSIKLNALTGFTAVVNKASSAKYDVLVENAPDLIKVLPWGKDFEVDVFHKPDFTANHYNIRESTGFKNVSLAVDEVITFIHPDDLDLYNAWYLGAFELQIANHKMLGHDSGKLFQEAADGSNNFDPKKADLAWGKHAGIPNYFAGYQPTHEKEPTWYKPGQIADFVLGGVSSSMEECCAEKVAMYLANNPTILKIFGMCIPSYSLYLMARAGLPHMQARKELVIQLYKLGITTLKVNEGLVCLEEVYGENGVLENIYVRVLMQGQSIVAKLLLELQVCKSVADSPGARAFYTKLTTPLPGWIGETRDVMLKMKQPHKMMLQSNTFVMDGEVVLKEYLLTPMIERNI
ncbi:peptidase family M49-domain-containing protein [Scleroderma yunnanense]